MSSRLTNKKSTASQKQPCKAQPSELGAIKPLVSNSQASKVKANKAKASRTKFKQNKKLNSQAFALSSTAFSVCVALSSHALPALINPVFANGPKGGVIIDGSGDISKVNATTTLINQTSQQMAINWDSYNIAGNIDANGKVILVNPNGIVFTQSSTLNIGSLVASNDNTFFAVA